MTSDTTEIKILSNLLNNEEYMRKVIPFLKDEYFEIDVEKKIFSKIKEHIAKYNKRPTSSILSNEFQDEKGIPEEIYNSAIKYLSDISEKKDENVDWLVDKTEKFCQERSLTIAVMDAIKIIDKKQPTGGLPALFTDALSVSFNTAIGHDYVEDAKKRFEYYHRKIGRIPFDIKMLNLITKGGFGKKTLNIFLAGTNVGKTLIMCHCAAANLVAGKNVLYITLEMSEEEISKRIDSNLLDVSIEEVDKIIEDSYFAKINRLKKPTIGKLVVKEYPAAGAGAGHFRHLLNELWLKKKFKPDIIYVDYLSICMPMRKVSGDNTNLYNRVISEELRALGTEKDVPIVTGMQLNRDGYKSSDPELTDIAESWGVTNTADWIGLLMSNETLEQLNQISVKQLKSRYRDKNKNKRFVIGIDRDKMRLYDCEQNAQENITKDGVEDDKPIFDKSPAGQKVLDEMRQDAGEFVWKKKNERLL